MNTFWSKACSARVVMSGPNIAATHCGNVGEVCRFGSDAACMWKEGVYNTCGRAVELYHTDLGLVVFHGIVHEFLQVFEVALGVKDRAALGLLLLDPCGWRKGMKASVRNTGDVRSV